MKIGIGRLYKERDLGASIAVLFVAARRRGERWPKTGRPAEGSRLGTICFYIHMSILHICIYIYVYTHVCMHMYIYVHV